jgi:hypothetical protein
MIRKGPKGISVFIFIFLALPIASRGRLLEKAINSKLTTVPIQKDNMTAQRPEAGPSIQPIPKINFPSPNPIRRPLEKSQSRTNGSEITGPAIKAVQVGKVKIGPTKEKLIKVDKKETTIKA